MIGFFQRDLRKERYFVNREQNENDQGQLEKVFENEREKVKKEKLYAKVRGYRDAKYENQNHMYESASRNVEVVFLCFSIFLSLSFPHYFS